ncbi:MAG: hypothetical protein HOQ19_13950 [Gemmatimonadaceae bacterium]|nr:hypothetical protein [Gemmatimonadaceae bacterium]NUO96220.1 hypothetical protein [Gemmatimonadaceae bacterium]NUP56931.1 hypothetical protein [Gemmatimonadaceae bacterium]NUP71874.1 hypothetical protein [Gemmatimonadaceae bacterium]NUR34034.1 hypothetical protein [Gemmatimonadaceae bacterium]
MTRMFEFPPREDGEPPRDAQLGALLRESVGVPPMADVDWSALAERVSAAIRSQQSLPWWGHVERWRLRAVPLALAAGLMGALALWNAQLNGREAAAPFYAGDAITEVVSGASSADAAGHYAGFVTTTVDVATGIPE